MKSMTGYGRGEGVGDGCRFVVEVTSVNRRQLEVGWHAPRDLDVWEVRVREKVVRLASRGRVTVRLTREVMDESGASGVTMNRPLARAYLRCFEELAREAGQEGVLPLEVLVRMPGVFQVAEASGGTEAGWGAACAALDGALAAWDAMRVAEGQAMAAELSRILERLRLAAGRVSGLAPGVTERYRRQLLERVRAAGLESVVPDDESLLREVVLFADRSDVSEELARLDSHFAQVDACFGVGEPVGRKLDFLAQELNREANTIGSKANDAGIAGEVVTLKTEIERFREQAQNVE